MRLQHRTAEDRINQLETEIKQWQDRALLAETRLRFIEKSIQQIAAEHVRFLPKKIMD
jgi:predicted  nucleic acid-binding Zn-ribbon protein